MIWEFYEVWAIDVDGREELVGTTRDIKEAKRLSSQALIGEDIDECVIYQETEDADLMEISRVQK
jgi:hypothetical protein